MSGLYVLNLSPLEMEIFAWDEFTLLHFALAACVLLVEEMEIALQNTSTFH